MLLRLLFFVFLLTMTVYPQIPPVETGVSQTLARWRAANYSDVRYRLNIKLEKQAPLMKGELEIRVNLTEEGAKNDLILDWRTTQFQNDKEKPYAKVVGVNNKTVSLIGGVDMPNYYVFNEHLGVSRFLLKTGENVIKIEFASPIKTSGAAVTRYVDKEDGAEYVYSLFVPSEASTAFPVFDQPDLKARFSLSLTVPRGWRAISNTEVESKFTIDTTHCRQNCDFDGFDFHETKPASTYVFAFAAGDFEVYRGCLYGDNKPEGKNVPNCLEASSRESETRDWSKIYVRKSQAEKFKPHAAETFRLNREAVKYLETYFDFKFPFPKYDLVLIPEFPFNGMEHAGATFLRESSVIFPSEPTKNDLLSRANVIFHEAAHQWFGDTVTMRWFDDLWLKEGFAEFMAYKTLEKVLPEYNAWKAFYERNKPLAYLTDSTKGTTPIYQEIPNLNSAKSAYGNIVYRKAPSFLKQAEFYLGEREFQTAVRAFLRKHQFSNAGWTDLLSEFNAVTKSAYVRDFSTAWVKQPGLFKIRLNQGDFVNSAQYKFVLNAEAQHSIEQNAERVMKFKILVINADGSRDIREFMLNPQRSSHRDTFPLSQNPALVFPNYEDYGYGIFLLDERSRAYVLENIRNEKDDFLRSMMWGTLWDSVREGELNPRDYVELAVKNIAVETDELTIQTILSRVSTAMNYYLSDAQRAESATKLEDLLVEKFTAAKTKGQRLTFYRAFLNIASSKKAQTVLKDILKANTGKQEPEAPKKNSAKDEKRAEFFELPALSTKDKFDIVTRLAVLGDADASRLLDELQKKETSDDAKRYAYAVGAGFGTKEAKEKYFNDFLNNKEISESWIESAFVPFNSVRHSELTLPHLEKALAELPNLKRSRKIFFVNGWLAAFIGGQKDEKALSAVNKFLANNPNLDKDLRLKIMENVDALERAVKIRAKYGK